MFASFFHDKNAKFQRKLDWTHEFELSLILQKYVIFGIYQLEIGLLWRQRGRTGLYSQNNEVYYEETTKLTQLLDPIGSQ